jgi:DnaK suppressor protein
MAARAKASTGSSEVALPVLEGEEPWSAEEIAEVRAELEAEADRIRASLAAAEAELADLMSEGSDGAGRDPADVGSSNFERDQEMSLNANARDMLEQTTVALRRLDEGTYGYCEVCGKPIGKARLEVFPRATMCVACKQREERR